MDPTTRKILRTATELARAIEREHKRRIKARTRQPKTILVEI